MRVFVSVDRAVARERCIKRNFAAGLSVSEEATTHRGELVQHMYCTWTSGRLLRLCTDHQQSMSPTWSMEIWWSREFSLRS